MTLDQTRPTPPIELRPATSDDEAFLFSAYASSRERELSLTGMEEPIRSIFLQHQFKAQQDHYLHFYPQATREIVLTGGRLVGLLWVNRGADEIRILDLVVLTAERGNGTGSKLVRDLQTEAANDGKRLSIYVEVDNPSLALFQRLGFITVEEKGPHLLQAWEPSTEMPAKTS